MFVAIIYIEAKLFIPGRSVFGLFSAVCLFLACLQLYFWILVQVSTKSPIKYGHENFKNECFWSNLAKFEAIIEAGRVKFAKKCDNNKIICFQLYRGLGAMAVGS